MRGTLGKVMMLMMRAVGGMKRSEQLPADRGRTVDGSKGMGVREHLRGEVLHIDRCNNGSAPR